MLDVDETIVAIATAPTPGVRGIVRISGPAALEVALACFTPDATALWPRRGRPRRLSGQIVLGPPLGTIAAQACVWPSVHSYSRQPTVEFHLTGARPVLEAVVARACRCGARPAGPGEFTLRSFLAGRIDLTQAEAVLGVIDATDNQALDVALEQLAGGLARPLSAVRERLIELLAELEASLDFADEPIELIDRTRLVQSIQTLQSQLGALTAQIQTRHVARSLPRVVFRGRPNAGKSSLLNVLAAQDAAIVSPVAGTTRDYVTARLHGTAGPYLLVDTAGVEQTASSNAQTSIEGKAAQIAQQQSRQADVELWCCDSTAPARALPQLIATDDDSSYATASPPRIMVWTKIDLADRSVSQTRAGRMKTDKTPAGLTPAGLTPAGNPPAGNPPGGRQWTETSVAVSSVSGAGIGRLRELIDRTLADLAASRSSVLASTSVRCRDCLARAVEAIRSAEAMALEQRGDELIAAELHHAADQIGLMAGTIYTDDLLDQIFSRFCIGK